MRLTQTLTLAIQTAPSFPAELLTFCILINCLMTKAKQDTKKEREKLVGAHSLKIDHCALSHA